MIYFVIPSSTGLVPSNLTVYIDRDPVAQSQLNLLNHSTELTGTSQTAANGVNIRDETFSFAIKNLPMETLLTVDAYFRYLKTGNLTIVFPEGSKNYYIDGWNVIAKNLLYGDITANLELMYL